MTDVTDFMDVYSLTLDDREAILELQEELRAEGDPAPPVVAPHTKAAFTRAYKAEHWEIRENTGSKKSATKTEGKPTTKKAAEPKKPGARKKKDDNEPKQIKKKAPAKKKAAPADKQRAMLQLQFG